MNDNINYPQPVYNLQSPVGEILTPKYTNMMTVDELVEAGILKRGEDDAPDMPTSKRCCRCEQILPIESFSKNRLKKDGYDCYCRECLAAIRKGWRKNSNKQK